MSLFNILCNSLIRESKSLEDELNCTIIIEKLEPTNNDSLNLKLTPIDYIKNHKHIEYTYRDKNINKEELISFKGNISELSAIVSNPVTNEIHTIKGK